MKEIQVPGLTKKCSQIILGTSFFFPDRQKEIYKMLETYIQHGGCSFDTAGLYGLGQSERLLGNWIKRENNRKFIVLCNKGGHHYVDEQGKHYPEQKRVRPEELTQDLMMSLEKFQTDYFDIYMFHRDDPDVPVDELIDVMEYHRNSGKIKVYGASNWSLERIKEANKYADKMGYAGISVTSPSFSLAQINEPRWDGTLYADNDYVLWNNQSQIPLLSWAAQASGFFTDKIQANISAHPDIKRVYLNSTNLERYKRAKQLGLSKGQGLNANNIALAYILNQKFPVCAIIGPMNDEELKSSLNSCAIQLSENEILWLSIQKDTL